MISQNDMSFLSLLPGYIVSRTDVASRCDLDLKQRHGSWFDGVGEMLVVDAERAFVIPARELSYVAPEQIRATRLPRLVKLVASEDAGVMCTLSGHVSSSWLTTFANVSVPKNVDTDRHFVKAFAPTHQGAIVGYHALRSNDGELSWRAFEQINGQQIRDLDFLSFEGKVHFVATTFDAASNKPACYARECGIKALKDNQPIHAIWSAVAFGEGHHVTALRGMLKDGARAYTFLDMTQGALFQAQASDKQPKVLKKSIKGVLSNVSGAMGGKTLCTVVTDDKVMNIGKDEQVVCDLTLPQHSELAGFIRDSKWVSGIVGRDGVAYLPSVTNALGSVRSAQLERIGG